MRYQLIIILLLWGYSIAQQALTPDQFLNIQRVSPIGISDDKQQVIYSVSTSDIASIVSKELCIQFLLQGQTTADQIQLLLN